MAEPLAALPVVRVHKLKTLYPWMTHVLEGRKNFEVRRCDREFGVGDHLRLCGWDGTAYTGEECLRCITYMLHGGKFGVNGGYVVLGLGPVVATTSPAEEHRRNEEMWDEFPDAPAPEAQR